MPINATVRGSFGPHGKFGGSASLPFTSFGVVAAQTKPTFYTSYTGIDPTGPHLTQLTRMTSKLSGRPGGLTYTDVVLTDDFFICFLSSHGGDYYNAVFLYESTYKDFTHLNLGGTNSGDYGYQSRYGVYITPSGFDVWDGINQGEGAGGNAGVFGHISGVTTSGYLGIRRVAGKFYTYYSNSAPGTAGFANMTLIHGPSTSTYTSPVRIGLFVHDADDYLEVYSPGTNVKRLASLTGGDCDGLGVSVAGGADGSNVTGYTNTGMTYYSFNQRNAGTSNNAHPLSYVVGESNTANFTFHTGHTFPDWWPSGIAIQVNASTPKVLNQMQWVVHTNGAGNVDIFGSNRAITASNYSDETLYTHLGRMKFNGSGSGLSDGTVVTQSFNAAGLGYKWYYIKIIDGKNGASVPFPYTDGHGSTTATAPNGWAMYGLRLNKI